MSLIFQVPPGLSSSHMSVNSEIGGDSSSNLSDLSDTSGTKTDGKWINCDTWTNYYK